MPPEPAGPAQAADPGIGLIRAYVRTREIVLLIVLALGASLTEGLGIIMLVPVLQLVETHGGGGSGAGANPVTRGWEALHLPLNLPVLLGGFVLLLALRSVLVQARSLAEMTIQARATARLRAELFGAMLAANWRFLSGLRGGSALSAVIGQVEQTGFALQSLLALGAALATLVAIGLGALLIAPGPVIAFAVGGLAVLAAYSRLRHQAAAQGERLGAANSRYFGFFIERLAALRLVKSQGSEAAESAEAAAVNAEITAARLTYQRGLAIGQIALETGAGVVLALGVWLALTHWQTPAPILLPMIALFARCIPLLQTTQSSWQNWAHARPALGEVGTLLARAQAAAEPRGDGLPAPDLVTAIRVELATVCHPGRAAPALDAVSAEFPARSTTRVSGPSGAGKSTLADLIGGMILPDAGRVTIDGRPLDEVGLQAWRARVAYVEQEPVLFHATIRANLLWARPGADEAQLRAALTAASAEFVLALPDGLDTVVGDRGSRLSGGERQRIALARGLLRAPELLILDEVTSALDPANEAAVARAVTGLRGQLTIVIIGHRSALADSADREVRLDHGKVSRAENTAKG